MILKIIADPQTVAIYGSTCSAAAATASRAMSVAGLTMISGNNSAPFLTSIGGHPAPDWEDGFFRTAANEEHAGRAAAAYLRRKLGLRTAATIDDGDIYTKGLSESFNNAFVALGGKVVFSGTVSKGEQDFLPVLSAVAHSEAEALFFPLFPAEASKLLLRARRMPELRQLHFISGGSLIEQSFLDAVGAAARGMSFVGPVVPRGPAVDKLALAYEARYHEKPRASYYLSGYDAANLLFHGLERTVVREPSGALHFGRRKLRDVLYATQGFQGVTGELSCDQFGDCAAPSFQVLRLDDPGRGLAGLEANVVFTPADLMSCGAVNE